MRTIKTMLAAILSLNFIIAAAAYADDDSSAAIKINSVLAGKDSVEISASAPLTYSYYKVSEPLMAVVDIAMVDAGNLEPVVKGNQGVISKITIEKIKTPAFTFSRIMISLNDDADIGVSDANGRRTLQLKLTPVPAAGTTEVAKEQSPGMGEPEQTLAPMAKTLPDKTDNTEAAKQTPAPTEAALPKTPTAAALPAVPTATAAPAAATAPAIQAVPLVAAATVAAAGKTIPETEQNMEAKRPVLKPVVPLSNTAKTITGIKVQSNSIEVFADYAVYNYKSFTMKKPGRLVLDFPQSKSSIKKELIQVNRFGVKKVRVGEYADKVRLVFDAAGKSFPAHSLQKSDDGLRIIFKK